MGSSRNLLPRKNMREIALAILGRHAMKRVQVGINCSPRQAYRIIHEDHTPRDLVEPLAAFLERMLPLAQQRLKAADDGLRTIRAERMVGRTKERLLAARRARDPQAH